MLPGFSKSPERLAPSIIPVIAGKILLKTSRTVAAVNVLFMNEILQTDGDMKFSLKVFSDIPV